MSSLVSSLLRLRRHERGPLEDERGVALVEFALVLPLLLLVIFAIVDFGRAFAFWNDQVHLASETARYAVVNSCPSCTGSQTLNDVMLAQAESSTASLKICFPLGTSAIGDPVHVTVKDTFTWIHLDIPFMGIHWTPAATDMVANSEMRLETATHDKYTTVTWDAASKTCT